MIRTLSALPSCVLPLFEPSDRAFVEAVARIARANPFLPERVAAECAALGPLYVPASPIWHRGGDLVALRENVRRILERLDPLLRRTHDRLARGAAATPEELALYERACLYLLYYTFDDRLQTLIGVPPRRVEFYDAFKREHGLLLDLPGVGLPPPVPGHDFAMCFLVRRAFHFLFEDLLGGTFLAAGLRAAGWRSIVSVDVFRFQRSLYRAADDIPTLVTGPTGTGKDVLARAIGKSRFLPFDEKAKRFVADHSAGYYPVNLSELAEHLIESELFGHARGAFTGALTDHAGWMERAQGETLFLDELGDLAREIQGKLIRVLQSREFTRVGSHERRKCLAKLVAATNRNLPDLMARGLFREDLYFRVSTDHITTPSLADQLDEAPDELVRLVRAIVVRKNRTDDVDGTTDRISDWIRRKAPPGYRWGGNMRELEHCVEAVEWTGQFMFEQPAPVRSATATTMEDVDIVRPFLEGSLTADEAERRYLTIQYARTGNLAETARRAEMDPRTVRDRIDRGLLADLKRRARW